MANGDHRIPLKDEIKLWELYEGAVSSYSPQTAEEARLKLYYEFTKRHSLVRSEQFAPENLKAKRITYGSLGMFLNATNISYVQMFEAISGKKISWNDEYEERMNALLEGSDSLSIKTYKKIFEELLPEEIKARFDLKENKAYKITSLISFLKGKDESIKHFTEIGLRTNWLQARARNCAANVLPLNAYPEISEYSGLPLHWLMELDETEAILSANGEVEAAMDVYCMLVPSVKKVLLDALENNRKEAAE